MGGLRIGILLAALATLSMASASSAAIYYVATNGSDSHPGTDSQPFRTIAKGLSVLQAGDTLFIKQGTYAEAINSNSMRIPTGTSWSTAVAIAAYPGHTVVLRPNSGGEAIALAASYIQYLLFDGLIIDGSNVSFAVSLTNGAHHIRFQNMEVKNARASGVILSNGSGATAQNQFVNMRIHSNGSSGYDHGLYIAASHNFVERCEIFRNLGYGVHVYNNSPGETANGNVIRYNRVYDNASYGIILSSGHGNIAYNNLVWGNRSGGIEIQWRSPRETLVYNNTVYSNFGAGILVGADSANARVQNNIVYNNRAGIVNEGWASLISNNLTDDPRFANAGGLDFSLQSASPAIDAGIVLAEVLDDFLGVARPQGRSYDIGAFEFRPGTPLPAPPSNLRVDIQ